MKERTITIRVKEVQRITIAGARVRIVKRRRTSMVSTRFVPCPKLTATPGRFVCCAVALKDPTNKRRKVKDFRLSLILVKLNGLEFTRLLFKLIRKFHYIFCAQSLNSFFIWNWGRFRNIFFEFESFFRRCSFS